MMSTGLYLNSSYTTSCFVGILILALYFEVFKTNIPDDPTQLDGFENIGKYFDFKKEKSGNFECLEVKKVYPRWQANLKKKMDIDNKRVSGKGSQPVQVEEPKTVIEKNSSREGDKIVPESKPVIEENSSGDEIPVAPFDDSSSGNKNVDPLKKSSDPDLPPPPPGKETKSETNLNADTFPPLPPVTENTNTSNESKITPLNPKQIQVNPIDNQKPVKINNFMKGEQKQSGGSKVRTKTGKIRQKYNVSLI